MSLTPETNSSRNVLVAVAWPYANGPRHVGHVAGFGVPSDIYARFQRMAGNNVLMVSGTDEHGTPITVEADQRGTTPRELVDIYNEVVDEDLRLLGMSYDLFTRTTTANHYAVVRDMFAHLLEKGFIYKATSVGAFDQTSGQALPDRYIEGECPHCHYAHARGDQCDNCGHQLDPDQLINPKSKRDNKPPLFRQTEHFFLDLPKAGPVVREWIEQHTEWRANVVGFSLNLLDNTVPRAITRDIEWGVPIPVPEYEQTSKRIYVWFDAVIGYLSAAIEWAMNNGSPESWRDWWQNPNAVHKYFMGKDNIPFHSVIWPSMLVGYGDDGALSAGHGPFTLPDEVVSSEYLTLEGQKFSTSRGIVVYVADVIRDYGVDALRYYLTAAGPETQDSDFRWDEFVRRNNEELVATWGNLVNRTTNMVHRYEGGNIPQPGQLLEQDQHLLDEVLHGFQTVGSLIDLSKFRAGLEEAMRLAKTVNQYLSQETPWSLDHDPARRSTVLFTTLQAIANINVMMVPFLPHASAQIAELVGLEGFFVPLPTVTFAGVGTDAHRVLVTDNSGSIGMWKPVFIATGAKLAPSAPVFRKLDSEIVEMERKKLGL